MSFFASSSASSKVTGGFVVDDTSILLLIGILSILLFSAISSRWSQPAVHPIILGRQSDVGKVHKEDQTPIYRNINAPDEFDLAVRPRKGAGDVASLLKLGAKGDEKTFKRSVYGKQKSNQDIVNEARRFGKGLVELIGGSGNDQSALAISVEFDHYESLQATLAGGLLGQDKAPFSTLVVPPLHLPEGQPSQLPANGSTSRLAAVYTTARAARKALAMSTVDSDTVFIVANQEELANIERDLQDSGKSPKLITFQDILSKGSDEGGDSSDDIKANGSAVHSSFWLGDAWTQVTNEAICAGVTANMAFYPADGIPSTKDRIFIEQSSFIESPSLHLGAAATPAGLSLAIMALYTGASLEVGPLTSSLTDMNPNGSHQLDDVRPTLIYASPEGASSLGLAHTASSKRSPFGKIAHNSKLGALSKGALNRNSIWDKLVFNSVRKIVGTDETRCVMIVGSGWVVAQRLVDILRSHLGCSVVNAFLPSGPLEAIDDDGQVIDRGSTNSSAWLAAPIACSHVLDVQSFKANNGISPIPAAVGPPSVSTEIKLVKRVGDITKTDEKETAHGWQRYTSTDDFCGSIVTRGTILTGSDQKTWYATGQAGSFRSNGTLLVLPPSIQEEKRGE